MRDNYPSQQFLRVNDDDDDRGGRGSGGGS